MNTPHAQNATLIEERAKSFAWFSTHAYGNPDLHNASPLYAWLAHNIASDPEILALDIDADRNQQVSNLLFAAVHFLLLDRSQDQDPLTDFYPDLATSPRLHKEAYPYFRAFCLKHADEIRHLVTTQRVQTNEVRRCTGLLPAFELVSQRSKRKPLALIELGSSAGLNLLWDRYGFDYGSAGYVGDKASPIQLHCAVQGNLYPPIPQVFPQIIQRLGIDLLPIDVRDEKATRWLRALIWPEHKDRAELLNNALTIAQQHPPEFIKGNVLDILPSVLANMPQETTLCIYHSYAMNQASANIRERIFAFIAKYATQRDLFRISLEWYTGMDQATLELFSYQQGEIQQEMLAKCESHGRWIKWLHTRE